MGAYLPDLAGVVALGASRDEVADRIQEALDAYAEEMSSLGPAPAGAGCRFGDGAGSLSPLDERGWFRRRRAHRAPLGGRRAR